MRSAPQFSKLLAYSMNTMPGCMIGESFFAMECCRNEQQRRFADPIPFSSSNGKEASRFARHEL